MSDRNGVYIHAEMDGEPLKLTTSGAVLIGQLWMPKSQIAFMSPVDSEDIAGDFEGHIGTPIRSVCVPKWMADREGWDYDPDDSIEY